MLFPTNFWASNQEVDLYAGADKTVTPFLTDRFRLQDSFSTTPVIWTIIAGQIYSPIDNRPLITLEDETTANPLILFDPEFPPLVQYSFTLRMTSVINSAVYDDVEIITRYESFNNYQAPLNYSSQDSYPSNYYVSNDTIEPFIEDPITSETCLRYVIQYPQRDNNLVTVDRDSPLIYHITNNILRIYDAVSNQLILQTSDFTDKADYPICDSATEVLIGDNSRTYVQTELGIKREFINSLYRITIYNLSTNTVIESFNDNNGYLPVTITCSPGDIISPFIDQYIYIPVEECGECSAMYTVPNNVGIYINDILNTLLPKEAIFRDITRLQTNPNLIFKDSANNELIKYQGIFNTVKLNNTLISPKSYIVSAIQNNLFKDLVGISPTKIDIDNNIKQAITDALILNNTNTVNLLVNKDCYSITLSNPAGCDVLNSSSNCYDPNTSQVNFISPDISWVCPVNTSIDSYNLSIGTLGSGVILVEGSEVKVLKFDNTLLTPITDYLIAEGIANSLITTGSTWANISTLDKNLLISSYIFKPITSVIKNLPCTYTINYSDSTNEVINITDPICPDSVAVLPQVLLDALFIETIEIRNLIIDNPFYISTPNGFIYSLGGSGLSYAGLYSYPVITSDTDAIYQNGYSIQELQPSDVVESTCYVRRSNYINHSFVNIEVPCTTSLTDIDYKYLEFNKEYVVTNSLSFNLNTVANLLTNIPSNQIEWSVVEGLGTVIDNNNLNPTINMTNSKIVLQAKYSDYIVNGLTICYEIPI